MTRKHFITLAKALKCTRPQRYYGVVPPDDTYEVRLRIWRKCNEAVADVCQSTNTRFDRDKFLAACGFDKD